MEEFLKFCTLKFHCLYMFKAGQPDLDKSKLIHAPTVLLAQASSLQHHMQLNMLFAILTISYYTMGCLAQVGNGIELEAIGLQFEPYLWLPCGVTWDSSRTVVVIKLL